MSTTARIFGCLCLGTVLTALAGADEPPAINPFGPLPTVRDDALPGYVELSDGSLRLGRLYLTRDARLKVFDEAVKQNREVPLRAVTRIDCTIVKEWDEKEWRFKENANDEKFYTGRSYPAREYTHTIRLREGRAIKGPLSAIVYVQAESGGEAERFLLHKRDKGPIGMDLKSLFYVRTIRLGEEAVDEARRNLAKTDKRSRK